MSVIRWEEPPSTRAAKPVKFAVELKANPGEWALIKIYGNAGPATSYAYDVCQGKSAWCRPAGSFEAVYRSVDGEHRVYARYVGGAR